jgi:hypothetical protein
MSDFGFSTRKRDLSVFPHIGKKKRDQSMDAHRYSKFTMFPKSSGRDPEMMFESRNLEKPKCYTSDSKHQD